MTTFTAPELVALVRDAAKKQGDGARRMALRGECGYVNVVPYLGDCSRAVVYTTHVKPKNAVLSCELTMENVASEDALVRALLASSITVTETPRRPFERKTYTVRLGSDRILQGLTGSDDDMRAEMVGYVLDALLAPTEDH